MHGCVLVQPPEAEHFNSLAQVRCECRGKDPEHATMPSPGSRNTLDMLRIVFDSIEHQDASQIILNDWSTLLSPEENQTVQRLIFFQSRLKFVYNQILISHEHCTYYLDFLDGLFAYIEQRRQTITMNVLRVGDSSLHMVHAKFYPH